MYESPVTQHNLLQVENENMGSSEKIPKSIYLDWNIFQDIIQDRKDERLLENLASARARGFVTPYSYAHMSDLARCGDLEYVDNDLRHVARLSASKYIEMDENHKNVHLVEVPPRMVLDHVRERNSKIPEQQESSYDFPAYKVAIEAIPEGNLLLNYLNRFDGVMSPALMNCLIQDLQERGLDDYKLQRDFRNSFIEVIKIGNPAATELLNTPIYKYMFSSKDEIENNFLEIFEFHLGITGQCISTISEHDKFTIGYGILDFFPAFKEKINKRNNMKNMLTDGLHVFIASKCRYLVCGDKGLIEKANLLYRVFEVDTRVYDVDTFTFKVHF